MKHLFVIYNPRSSRYADVESEVLSHLSEIKGCLIGKYEVAPTNIDDNIDRLTKLLEDGDLVISAGGDATGIIASNAILKSGKDVTLAALPYGNFNDLARTLRTKRLSDVIKDLSRAGDAAWGTPSRASARMGEDAAAGPARRFYPLEIIVDGKFFRYATCYVTIGMTAEAVSIYDSPKMRAKLKNAFGRKITSYTELSKWYFKNRHKHAFIPEFSLNGELQSTKTSDYAAVNGRSMARVMRGGEDYHDPKFFRHETDRLTNFYRLVKLMMKSIFSRIPGTATDGDILKFTNPSTVTLQAEGESVTLKDINKIEIRKSKKCLKVIEN